MYADGWGFSWDLGRLLLRMLNWKTRRIQLLCVCLDWRSSKSFVLLYVDTNYDIKPFSHDVKKNIPGEISLFYKMSFV